MADYVEKEGKTIEAAIEEALLELNIEEKDAEIQVIDEGSKGLFGIIGGRNALVRVSKKVDYERIVREFLEPIFDAMAINEELEITQEDDCINVRVFADDIGIIIGRRGETLDALQYLLGLVVNKNSDNYIRVTFDVAIIVKRERKHWRNLPRNLPIKWPKTGRVLPWSP